MRPSGFTLPSFWIVCALCACTLGPVQLKDRIAQGRATLRAARAGQAERMPLAARHFTLAEAQLNEAQALLAQGNSHRAAYLVDRAEAEAALAQALVQGAPTQDITGERVGAPLDMAHSPQPDDPAEPVLPADLDEAEPDAAGMPLERTP
jgi:hypothetical protein